MMFCSISHASDSLDTFKKPYHIMLNAVWVGYSVPYNTISKISNSEYYSEAVTFKSSLKNHPAIACSVIMIYGLIIYWLNRKTNGVLLDVPRRVIEVYIGVIGILLIIRLLRGMFFGDRDSDSIRLTDE